MLKLVHYSLPGAPGLWGAVGAAGLVHRVASDNESCGSFLAVLLQLPDPAGVVRAGLSGPSEGLGLSDLAAGKGGASLLAPLDRQEVWAAGVTYLRSKVARMGESEGAARFYDLVYDAERPELFLKATPSRVSGPGEPLRIREDARWNVPEPELALLITQRGRIAGYTIGNDMSSRDIEGENPLYLPQAKVYRQSCGLGPAIVLAEEQVDHREFEISLVIERGGSVAFEGTTSSGRMKRTFGDLSRWLFRENDFPHGTFLCTGTGLVPSDEFTLQAGDMVSITVPEIGTLANPVVCGG
jgi:2-dehydro-3-deoxy-D-arabinonate dehydratase